MRLRSFFTLVFYMCLVPYSLAEAESGDFENVKDLRVKIKNYSDNIFRQEYGEKTFIRDVRLRISQLDSRLKLTRCEENIHFELIRPAHQSRNLTVKTQCNGKKRWTIYVPLTLEVYADVVVAARNLNKGTVLTNEDIKTTRIDTSTLPSGHVVDKSRVLGLELGRNTRIGSYLLLSSLEKPRVVNKGDSVVVESRQSSLSVSTKGTALGNGQVGEQIKVRNDRSERIVDALVTGPGRVTVVAR